MTEPGSASVLGSSTIAWWRCGSSFSPFAWMRVIPWRVNTDFKLARGGLDACEELARDLVLPELVADCGECAVQVILDRQHVAGKIGGGVAGRLLQLRFQAPTDVLRLGCRVESLVLRFLELPLKLGEAVVLLKLRRFLRGFVTDFFRLVVQLAVFGHAINLVSAFAVKSTMGTTRA